MSLPRVTFKKEEYSNIGTSQLKPLPIGRTRNFPEGSIARKYTDVYHQSREAGMVVRPQAFPKNRTIRGNNPGISDTSNVLKRLTEINPKDQLVNQNDTFIKKVQALLRRKFNQQENLPPFLQLSIKHWTAHSTIRKLTKSHPELSDNMVQSIADIIEAAILQGAKQTHVIEARKTRIARDLATLSQEQIEENNPHNLPLPVKPRPVGMDNSIREEEKIQVAQSFVGKTMNMVSEKIAQSLEQKQAKRALFEKQLEKPLPYQGFAKTQLRRNPATIKQRMVHKRQEFTDPAELFGVDRTALDLPNRDNYLPRRGVF